MGPIGLFFGQNMEGFALGLVIGILISAFGVVAAAYLTERGRVHFDPVGPTVAQIHASWLFYYEFQPRIGVLNRSDTAAFNAGGAINLKDRGGQSKHQAETFWAGVPVASTANLYTKRGLLVFQVYPKGHMVLFYSAGTAPHADQLQLGFGAAGAKGFDWTECEGWKVEITVSAPEAAAKTVTITVEDLCKKAKGPSPFPGVSKVIKDQKDIKDGMLIKGSGDSIYLVENGKKRLFPTPEVFVSHDHRWVDVVRVSDELIEAMPSGSQMLGRDDFALFR